MSDSGQTRVLEIAVRSLEGEVILPAGTTLSQAVYERIAAGGPRRWAKVSLLGHGTVRRDLARGVRTGGYATVFGDDAEYRDLERILESVELPEPCLRGLSWFQEHDASTYHHILMVFALTCLLSRDAGHGVPEVAAEAGAGPLHDFGKLCVPLGILRKRTALTRAERRKLEQHTLAGHVLLCHYLGGTEGFPARVARDHHERRDGSGYPHAITLTDPLIEIVAACDIYDALVSARPYRESSFDNRTALEELTQLAQSGKVSWEIVQLLVARNRRDRPSPDRCEVSLERRGCPPEGNLYGIYADDEAP